MIIEIRDIPENSKISKIVVDFDNGTPKTTVLTNQTSKKSQKEPDGPALDLDYLNAESVSQEIVKKPEIPDKKREIKVSSSMQNLKI